MALKETDWIPNLSGRLDPQSEQAVQYLFRAVYSLRNGTGINAAGIKRIVGGGATQILNFTTPAAAKNLAAGGSNPLTIQNLPGVSSSPQPAALTPVTSLPPSGDPLSVVGSTVIYQGVQWTYTLLPGVSASPFWLRSSALSTTLQGTHAERVATSPDLYPIGTQWYETDTTITYQIQNTGSNIWLYINGVFRDVLANIPTGLGADDAQYWFKATDYLHDYNWDGAAWHFASADSGSDFQTFTLNPTGPNGGLWGKCDGSTYNVAQDDGTIAAVVSPITANNWLRR